MRRGRVFAARLRVFVTAAAAAAAPQLESRVRASGGATMREVRCRRLL